MQRITIGRYKAIADVPEGSIDVADLYDGWIEGIRDDGSTWIVWLDATGSPEVFWPRRDENGGVEGEPISLST